MATPQDVIGFWTLAGPEKWFAKSDGFDQAIRLRFEPTHFAAARGEYDSWAASAEGALALLLLLDQFPRNLFRNSGHAFATDLLARRISRDALAAGFDKQVDAALRPFFYLPLQHSEDRADQDQALAHFDALAAEQGDPEIAKWARHHHEVILRFGRFPHRNKALGRKTTPEEQAFLDEDGFKG
ncbi:DUF924 family protein [Caulobacter sp. NIBR2454]|uniref:DUF924 family protein n=1 Tax=Caulobacter sp. NIBR2454 TaxID=3015996 RepID=UPI0022B6DFE5|nr:DUF924 family protein [Caulobacter sp. NIBR2454]